MINSRGDLKSSQDKVKYCSDNMSKKRNSFELIVPHMNKKIERLKLVPPDGGWGWMVLLGTALSNIFNQSMLSLFSLLYGDALEAMGYNTQGAAIVNSTMLFVGNLGGLLAGAIVKLTSTRFVSVTGAVLCTSGILLSGFSTNIWHFILTYGVLLGLGLGFIQNASFVAINSYFKVRKNLAVGLAVVGTGVGQTLMPHVVQYLLDNFGFKGACLLLASLSAHGICGTLLMQPVEWHMKQVVVEINENMYLLEENNKVKEYNVTFKGKGLATEPTLISESAAEKANNDKVLSQSYKELQINKNGKSAEILNENYFEYNSKENYGNYDIPKKTLSRKIYDLFDISLLSNPRFLNVIIGIAILSVSVLNFSMLFPLFLQKKVFMDKKNTALCMSAVSLADIVGRLTLPALQDKYHIKARIMMIMTCFWLLVVRQILAYQTNLYVLLTMSALYGLGKSMVIVAKNIAISEECRTDQVPSAIGLGMLGTGIIVPPAGYFLGWIRDYTDSYIVCITAQNLLLVVFLVMWIPDMILIYNKKRKENRKNIEQATN